MGVITWDTFDIVLVIVLFIFGTVASVTVLLNGGHFLGRRALQPPHIPTSIAPVAQLDVWAWPWSPTLL